MFAEGIISANLIFISPVERFGKILLLYLWSFKSLFNPVTFSDNVLDVFSLFSLSKTLI